ncbi:MAG: hypothetical protein MKZ89_00680 [Nisaea sp.]|nr:hypothetical protein [Nisaea sp.]
MRAIQTYKEATFPIGTAASKHDDRKVWSTIRIFFDGCRVTLVRRDGDYVLLPPLTFTAILPRQNLDDWCSKMVSRLKLLWKFVDQSLFLVIREHNLDDKAYAYRRYTERRNEGGVNGWKPC